MKVATLWFERTVHSHFLMENTSSGTRIFMSCLTFTWHARRQCSLASARVMWVSSVGRMSPPPSKTWHLHIAQVPPPPQADGRKIPWDASADSKVPPAGRTGDFSGSSLIRILTLPCCTSRRSANIRIPTSAKITTTSATTPVRMLLRISAIGRVPAKRGSELDPAERHERHRDQTGRDEGDAEPA